MLYGRDAERSAVTTLLDAARDSRSGVLEARGIESEAELAFAGLHQLLRPILGQVDGLPGPQATALRAAFGLEQGRVDDRFFVARRLEAEGVVVLFAARDGDPRRFGAVGLPELEIGGLDGVAVAALLAERAAVPVAPQVRDRLLERTGCNPLALVELPSVLT